MKRANPQATEQETEQETKPRGRRSKLATRLVRLFVLLAGVPLVVTMVLMVQIGREQVAWTSQTLQKINGRALHDASRDFQHLGSSAVHRSSEQTAQTSLAAVNAVSARMTKIQAQGLTETAGELSGLTSASFDNAMRRSLSTQRATMAGIQMQTSRLFTRSTLETQQQAAGNIERSMLALDDTLMHERAQRLAERLRSHIENAPHYLKLTAQMLDMRDSGTQGRKETLDSLVRWLPAFLLVTVLDRKGQEIAMSASDHLVTASDLSRREGEEYFRTALRGDLYVGRDGVTTHNGAPVLRFAVPIEAYRGKVIGVLAARYSLEDLWDEIRNTRIGAHGFAYVLDRSGAALLPPRVTDLSMLSSRDTVDTLHWQVVVAVPRAEAMQPIYALKTDIAHGSQRALFQMRQEMHSAAGVAARELEHATRSLRDQTLRGMRQRSQQAFQKVQRHSAPQIQAETNWMRQKIRTQTQQTQRDTDRRMMNAADLAVRQLARQSRPLADQAIQRAERQLSILVIVLTLVSCGLGSALALVTARKIVRPVVRLAQVTQSIASGELDKRVDENAPDEIGELAVAFNKMAASLQQSRAELSEAEGQLVQSAKLASLGTLSAGVAHELNQPLAIIRGVTQQLRTEEGLSEDVQSDLDLIENQTGRMIKIIRHLRTFCRAGNAEFAHIDVNKSVEDCFILVGAQLRAHNVEVELQLCPTPPPVLGDANELEQVFLNLITNARDAMEGRPDARITIRSYVNDSSYRVEFRDNGTGIPQEIANHIFDPFFTTKEPGKGTGLGLSISHSIIAKHKGEIRVHNDGGAVFTITLPLATEENAEMAEAA
jgi:C4-dicarboxylate-specific signal transduction histidine kinase